jgi:hypothetical protein
MRAFSGRASAGSACFWSGMLLGKCSAVPCCILYDRRSRSLLLLVHSLFTPCSLSDSL